MFKIAIWQNLFCMSCLIPRFDLGLVVQNHVQQGIMDWPAPGSEDTELGVLMEPEVGHGETEVHAGVQR
jgi:hypothetical protein